MEAPGKTKVTGSAGICPKKHGNPEYRDMQQGICLPSKPSTLNPQPYCCRGGCQGSCHYSRSINEGATQNDGTGGSHQRHPHFKDAPKKSTKF